MCKFFSGVIERNKTVHYLPGVNCHTTILESVGLSDHTDSPGAMQFARFEITQGSAVFDDFSKWILEIDERIRPEWWSPAHEVAARTVFKRYMTEQLSMGCFPGDLDLRGYTHPLPQGLTSVGGSLYLRGYTHPLPQGLRSLAPVNTPR